jgi:hypothetical protein
MRGKRQWRTQLHARRGAGSLAPDAMAISAQARTDNPRALMAGCKSAVAGGAYWNARPNDQFSTAWDKGSTCRDRIPQDIARLAAQRANASESEPLRDFGQRRVGGQPCSIRGMDNFSVAWAEKLFP